MKTLANGFISKIRRPLNRHRKHADGEAGKQNEGEVKTWKSNHDIVAVTAPAGTCCCTNGYLLPLHQLVHLLLLLPLHQLVPLLLLLLLPLLM
jgi:hypothetical protein